MISGRLCCVYGQFPLFHIFHRPISKSYVRNVRTSAQAVKTPITVPQRVTSRKVKDIRKVPKVVTNASGTLIISSRRRELNHHKGNRYGNKQGENIDPKYLASGGWLHYKAKGDYFTINPHAKMQMLNKSRMFRDLKLDEDICTILKQQKIMWPSHIQVETIPVALELDNVLCVAETGCGKTLAYLLPILQNLKNFRLHGEQLIESRAGLSTSPRAVVIIPSKELADQVASVAKSFCEPLNLKVASVCGGRENHKLITSLKSCPDDLDLLVSTPGSLSVFLSAGAISPDLVNHVIIDEADTMMDDTFSDLSMRLLRKLSTKASGILGMQIILAGATMPKDLTAALGNLIQADGFVKCTTSAMHHVIGHISQKFVRMGPQDKVAYLLKLLKEGKDRPTIVFANTCATATFLNHLLSEHQLPSILLHGKVPEKERQGRFQGFHDGVCNLLVCSDIASRGLDTIQTERIINYDFPKFMSDYIHRVGRIGRLGSSSAGQVINMVGHRPEVDLVWQIERAVRQGTSLAELPKVNANIKRQIQRRVDVKYGKLGDGLE